MSNLDQAELDHFNAHVDWWDEYGAYRLLHKLNPIRLGFIERHCALKGQTVIDVGCGGGLLTEAMSQAGAMCTGLDLGETTLKVAKDHAAESGLDIDYQLIPAEEFAAQNPERYDIVVCYEMLEHVPDPASIVKACCDMLKPNGWLFLSTLNRTVKAYVQAIIGAEYLLKLLPKGTHAHSKFIKPSELLRVTRQHGLSLKQLAGIDYSLCSQQFTLNDKVDVNYVIALQKHADS